MVTRRQRQALPLAGFDSRVGSAAMVASFIKNALDFVTTGRSNAR
jgi:hypothetical protein